MTIIQTHHFCTIHFDGESEEFLNHFQETLRVLGRGASEYTLDFSKHHPEAGGVIVIKSEDRNMVEMILQVVKTNAKFYGVELE